MNSRRDIQNIKWLFAMDKKILVEKIKNIIASFKKEGKDFSFVGLQPVYPDSDNTSYILVIRANWLDEFSDYQSIAIITRRLFELLDKKTLKYINRVEVHNKTDFDQWSVTRNLANMNYQAANESKFEDPTPWSMGRNMAVIQYQI
jgi:hypothetical protein